MNIAPKAVLTLPRDCEVLADIGNYYVVGDLLFTKSLDLLTIDRRFDIPPYRVPRSDATPVDYLYCKSKWASNQLKGTNGSSYFHTGTDDYGTEEPHSHTFLPASYASFISDSISSPYFDSASGSTSGRRFIAFSFFTFGEILSDGTFDIWHYGEITDVTYGTTDFSEHQTSSWVYHESSTHFFLVSFNPYIGAGTIDGSTAQINWTFWDIDKVSKEVKLTTLGNGSYGVGDNYTQHHGIRYLGLSNDGFGVFVIYPLFSGSSRGFKYVVVDFTQRKRWTCGGSTSNAALWWTPDGQSNHVTAIPSERSSDQTNPTYYKYYVPAIGSLNTTNSSIYRVRVPKSIGIISSNNPHLHSNDNDTTICSLLSLPVGVALTNPSDIPATSGTYNRAEADLWCLFSGGNEYVVYFSHAYHGNNMVWGAPGVTQRCDSNRHRLVVFKIDPTDTTKLTWKSNIDSGLGVGQVFQTILLSSDRKLVIAANDNGFMCLNWSDATEAYIPSMYQIVPNLATISLDELHQIWCKDWGRNVFVFHPTASVNVSLKFENNISSLLFDGTPITANLVLNVYDFNGVRLARTVKIDLVNATFTSDGAITRNVNSSTSADTLINITIDNAGVVNATPSLL